jgi:DNA-binding CsgD family transcriptional regulator
MVTAVLTERQAEVLRLFAKLRSRKEVGRALGISDGVVKQHLEASRFRIAASSGREVLDSYQAAEIAHELGLL